MKAYTTRIIFCLICSWLLTLCACQPQMKNKSPADEGIQKNQVLVCGFSDSSSGVKLNKEYSFGDTSRYTATDVEKEKTICVDGKEIMGTYSHSVVIEPNYFPTHYYNTLEGDSFGINPDGVVTNYNVDHRSIGKNDELYTEEQCVLMARQFVNQFVNIEGYSVRVTEDIDKDRYDIAFTKMIGAFETTEYACVRIYKNGSVDHYRSFMLGKITDDDPTLIQAETIKEAIYRRLDDLYEPRRTESNTISYRDLIIQYTVLKSGTPAAYCTICVDHRNQDNMGYSERLILLVGL